MVISVVKTVGLGGENKRCWEILNTLSSEVSFREKDKKSDQKNLIGNINRRFGKKWGRRIGKTQYSLLYACRYLKFKKCGEDSITGQSLEIQQINLLLIGIGQIQIGDVITTARHWLLTWTTGLGFSIKIDKLKILPTIMH